MPRILTNDDLTQLMASPQDRISFVSTAKQVAFSLRGKGTVVVLNDDNHQTIPLREKEPTEVTVVNPVGPIYVDGASCITEMDIHGQSVKSFSVNVPCDLNKLVIYDNDLSELDCSNCKNLQFLHMHNNPICDDDVYKDNLIACMRSLPNRVAASTGSIILYPWYGLEVLICKDAEGNFIKYPTGFSALAFEEGRLYGVVDNDTITYVTFTDGDLQNHSAMNRHHALRKQLEADVCLRKNWIFGSAIMYDEHDWAKCPWDFRDSHIADMWETSEKGFGLTYGGFDHFTNTLLGFENFNVVDFCMGSYDRTTETASMVPAIDYYDSSNEGQYNYDQFVAGKWHHGDSQLSMLFGHGEEADGEVQRFGYIPNACCCLVDQISPGYTSVSGGAFAVIAEHLTSNCQSISFSFYVLGGALTIPEARNILGVFGENNIFTQSAGNDGDGKPYTSESDAGFSALAGNYTVVDEDGNEVEKPSTALFIGGVAQNKSILGLSPSSKNAADDERTRSSYLCHYADGPIVFHNKKRKLISRNGTSFAAPLCNGVLMLMRNIYAKMFPGETSFGKWSNFINHVNHRWCNNLEAQMDLAVGYGFPDVLADPCAPQLLGEAPKVEYRDTVTLGNALDIDYMAQKYSKQGYTPENKPSSIAVSRNGQVYPLVPGPLSLRLYSNSSQKVPTSYAENYFASDIEVDVLPNVMNEVEGSLSLSLSRLSNQYLDEEVVRVADTTLTNKEFTVQFALDFTDKLYPVDAGTYTGTRDLLYFINGKHVGYHDIYSISYKSGDAYITFAPDCALEHQYYEGMFGSGRAEQNETCQMGYGLFQSLDMKKTPYAIITMTCSEDGINYFLNGTNIGHIRNVPEINIKVSDVFVNKESLCHDAVGCVRIYNRVLTDEEIIQNTICMLNSHFEEG